MAFPFPVHSETSEEIAFMASEQGLLSLCAHGCVIGIGTWTKLRKIRLNNAVQVMHTAFCERKIPVAAANRTVIVEDLSGEKGMSHVFTHHRARCRSYALNAD